MFIYQLDLVFTISISKETINRFEELIEFNLLSIENLKVCKFHFWLNYSFF